MLGNVFAKSLLSNNLESWEYDLYHIGIPILFFIDFLGIQLSIYSTQKRSPNSTGLKRVYWLLQFASLSSVTPGLFLIEAVPSYYF